jgi:hypothetical protein
MKNTFFTLILIISVQFAISQPIIGIGKSKNYIGIHMKDSLGWDLISASKRELIYSDGYAIFTYIFSKDEPGRINQTCTRCIAEFHKAAHLAAYLNKKVDDWQLRPNPDMLSLIVVTDLYDDTIQAVVVGDRRIVFSY